MGEEKINTGDVRDYYDDPNVVNHYRRATANVGLWKSEDQVFQRIFSPRHYFETFEWAARFCSPLQGLEFFAANCDSKVDAELKSS